MLSAWRAAPMPSALTHPQTQPMFLGGRAGGRASGSPRSADTLLSVSTVWGWVNTASGRPTWLRLHNSFWHHLGLCRRTTVSRSLVSSSTGTVRRETRWSSPRLAATGSARQFFRTFGFVSSILKLKHVSPVVSRAGNTVWVSLSRRNPTAAVVCRRRRILKQLLRSNGSFCFKGCSLIWDSITVRVCNPIKRFYMSVQLHSTVVLIWSMS